MRALVTGGAGYIGSHTVRELLRAGHEVVVLDDLSTGHRASIPDEVSFVRGDFGDSEMLSNILRGDRIDAVVHLAGHIDVAESIRDPSKCYRINFASALRMLETMRARGVRKVVHSSTADVYGLPAHFPVTEETSIAPLHPYGMSNAMTERAIQDAGHAYGLRFAILRYYNVAGASEDGSIGEAHRPETHLIPRILASASRGEAVAVFGTDYGTPDGTCVRDFVHVVDLARAHVMAMERLDGHAGEIFNLGSERGFSVLEIIDACKRVTGIDFEVKISPRRPGDLERVTASSERMRAFGWQPKYDDLEMIVSHAWNWHRSHPEGYES